MFPVRLCPLVFFFFMCHAYDSWTPPPHHQRIPQDVMVDVVNNLGLKLLAIHNEHNDNNIAISPYGALSVLVVLGEGLRGPASDQILQAARIPPDIALIRVGLRDIHRHLKSYFIPEEGFLAGLTLNNDNVTLNQDYEEILMFYGYDLSSFNSALYPDFFTTHKPASSTEMTGRTNESEMTTDIDETTVILDSTSSTETSSTVTTVILETTVISEDTTPLMGTTEDLEEPKTERASTEMIETTTIPTTLQLSVSENIKIDMTTDLPTTKAGVTTPKPPISTTEMSTTMRTSPQESTMKTSATESVVATTTNPPSTTEEIDERTTSTIEATTSPSTTASGVVTSSSAQIDDITTIESTTSNDIVLNRTTRSLVDYVIARYYDDLAHRPSYHDQLTFLVNGEYRESNIEFMTYDTALPFYYIPHLDTLALSFPLDSTKYYLLLLLPVDETGIDRLICDLSKMDHNLRYIIEKLRYTRVKALIPSFMLKGYIILTPTMQKLGIRKVFEPRQADFTPMTPDVGIYVTNIEQAITVTIRNYVEPSTMDGEYGNLRQYEPVHFRADHPFLYFVIDAELNVALMAGKIINPLNSRIR